MTDSPVSRLCFIDTETTSLRPDRRAWEVGLVVRDPGSGEREFQWFIDRADLDLGNADLFSLKVGRFYERHPQMAGHALVGLGLRVPGEAEVMAEVEKLTRGAHLVGAVPNFDAEVLAARMRANGICPSWHYHLIDIEPLAVGYLSAYSRAGTPLTGKPLPLAPPWKSDDLSAALGVTVSEEDRHTALGDAKWARAVYDVVMGSAP
jgi:DNA polymerase III epsilon subunit-like protein